MKKYITIIQKSIKQEVYYNSQVLLNIITTVAGILMMQYFWKALYTNNEVVKETTLIQMCVYSSMSWFLNLFNYEDIQDEVIDKVKSGDILNELVKPYNYIGYLGCAAIGKNLWGLLVKGVPLLIVICFVVEPSALPQEPFIVLASIITMIIGNCLLFLVTCIMALFSFFFIEISGILMIKEMCIVIFSGLIIPTWFYPEILQKLINFMPFPYMIQMPLAIFCGKVEVFKIGKIFFAQIFWGVIGVLILKIMWCKIVRRDESFGG